MAWRSLMSNQTSTMFIHDALVGVKCTWTRAVVGEPVADLDTFVGGAVVITRSLFRHG